ncbi:TPR domain protein [Polychaeton citri CBS 116435]|uniref:TPR domain protein n=1 Tax=Polychaeton citri CBS 116435 TaxID=1314669 RepID=A0A9P4QGH3_9PEZI|nr:TPR domain protein [Polychaeton citri CBS 116435]
MMSTVKSSKLEVYDLGKYTRIISTSNPAAQTWFNQGLIWSYAFNHQASAESFEHALVHDADCAMAFWGLAYTLGPNYNKPWAVFEKEELADMIQRTHRASQEAQRRAATATPVEQALIKAVQCRYPQEFVPEDCDGLNKSYADAMALVYEEFSDDLDVAALYADALMNLTPWALWDISSGAPAEGARTTEVKDVLDRGLATAGGTQHPGLLHLYIHLMEMSSTPETALPAANQLRGLVPDAGHLHHMPTHLDVLCGDYLNAIQSNSDAILADERYLDRAGAMNFYSLYRCHNYHFRIYAAMFAGQSAVALETVAKLEASIPEELLRVKSPPMADWLEGFLAMRVHALVRFGRWREITDLEIPQDRNLYCSTVAMSHYAKGIAYAILGDLERAGLHQSSFYEAVNRVSPSRTIFNNTCVDILRVAAAMLDGELAYRRGNIKVAFGYLCKAIQLDDALPYDEPWAWMQPTRHAYGALLLEQGDVAAAMAVYRADLGLDEALPRALQHRNNVWSLHGYHECLVKLGHNEEAGKVLQQLEAASAVTDVSVTTSCFCRLGTSQS